MCRQCKAVFPATEYQFSESRNVWLGNLQVQCRNPGCSGPAYVLDGTYDFVGGTISILASPSVTIEVLEALGATLVEAYERDESLESLQGRVARFGLGLAKWFSPSKWPPEAKATLIASILGAITAVGVAKCSGEPTVSAPTVNVYLIIRDVHPRVC
jgi:hypothetical protein